MSCTSAEDTRSRITKVLDDSVSCALDLKVILNEERQALEDRDTEALNTAATTKLALVSKFAKLNQSRGVVSEKAGFGNDPDDLDALAAWCDDDLTITSTWQQLQEIASECDVINRTNGAIIHLRRQQILDGLSVLRGGENETSTYAPAGAAEHGVSGRAITEA